MSDTVALFGDWGAAWAPALWRAAWQGGIALGLAWGLCRLLPRLSPRVRCWLWRLAYLKLLVALAWSTPVPLPLLSPGAGPAPPAPASIQPPASAATRVGLPRRTTTGPASSGTPRPHSPAGTPSARSFAERVVGLAGWLLLPWLAGVAWCTAPLARELAEARKLRRAAQPVADLEVSRTAAGLAARLGFRRPPPLLVADSLTSPLLLGVVRPAVVLPAALLTDSTDAEIRLMLAHEFAHLRRRDLLWSWLPAAAQALFFFHPLVWLGNREWRRVQETACDELALALTHAPAGDYGGVLVKVAAAARPQLRLGFATFGGDQSPETLKLRLVGMRGVSTAGRPGVLLLGAMLATVAMAGIIPWRLTERAGAAAGRAGVPLRTGWPFPELLPAPLRGGETGSGAAGGAPVGPPPGFQAAAPDGSHRYRLVAGRAHTYSVRIEAEDEDVIDGQVGSVTYTVRSVEPDGFTLAIQAALAPHRRAKPGRLPRFGPMGPRGPTGALTRFGLGPSATGGPWVGNEVKIDPFGRVLRSTGEMPRPLGLGNVPRLAVEPLPADGFKRLAAANSLAAARPRGERAAAARALERALQDQDLFVRQAAARALEHWGTPESVPHLIRRLEDREHAVRWVTIEVLGRLGDPRAAAPLAEMVDRNRDRHFASRALQAMGSVAEPAALGLLNSGDSWARLEGCRILKVAGTTTCLPTLRAAAGDNDGLVKTAAQDAVREVESRR